MARRKRVGFPGAIYHVMFFRTPQPNLSRGMQTLLGGYASWWNQKYREIGHLFQGRFKSRLVENEGYFWTVSRYVHLNPVPALCSHPADWAWSSYRGYADTDQRLPWVAYDVLLAAWQGGIGGEELSFRGGTAGQAQPIPLCRRGGPVDFWF